MQVPYPARESKEWVIDRWDLEPTDIEQATATVDPTASPALAVSLTKEAGDRMREYSQRMIGHSMAMILDDQIVVLAMVNDAISTKFVISGNFTDEEITDLVRSLDRTHR